MNALLLPSELSRSELLREILVIEPYELVLLCKTFADSNPNISQAKTHSKGVSLSLAGAEVP